MTDAGRRSSGEEAQRIPTAGRPLSRTGRKYRLSAVGFVDTLGAKALSSSEVFLNALAYMVDLQKRISLTPRGTTWVRTTYFSDNIGASVVIEGLEAPEQKKAVGKLLRLLGAIQLFYLRESSILCSGGVAIGPCFHDDNVIFGPALVEAYSLELQAETPRIVVTDHVVRLSGDEVVALHVAEPLRSQKGIPGDSLRSIDFMRAELPGPQTRKNFIAQLEAAVAKGSMGLGGNASVAKKWKWTSDKLKALKDELGET